MTTPSSKCIVASLPHHLDHLVPISFYTKIPLVVRNLESVDILCDYYPTVPFTHIKESQFLSEVEEILCTSNSEVAMRELHQALYGRTPQIVRLHHGYSDKVQDFSWYDRIIDYKEMPNYRLQFYQEHRAEMLSLAKKLLPIAVEKKPLLIALSWDHPDTEQRLIRLATHPEKDRFVFRLHPLLVRNWALDHKLEAQHQIHLIDHNCPYIYPFLELCAGVLTDYSSIAYDALYFQKPLMVLDDVPLKQHSCTSLESWIESCDQDTRLPHFQTAYHEIFG